MLQSRVDTKYIEKGLENLCFDDTRAMRLYLRCMRWQYEAFLAADLSPLQRLYRMAYVMFVFRIWRNKISRKSNFVSHNCYVCLEINFGGLIILINNLRDNGFDEYFLPFYIQSQHCEGFFRTMRSWAGSQSTKIDGTVLECLSTIRQIHSTQSQALYLTENGYEMPKQGKYDKIKSIPVPKLPSNEQNKCQKCLNQL